MSLFSKHITNSRDIEADNITCSNLEVSTSITLPPGSGFMDLSTNQVANGSKTFNDPCTFNSNMLITGTANPTFTLAGSNTSTIQFPNMSIFSRTSLGELHILNSSATPIFKASTITNGFSMGWNSQILNSSVLVNFDGNAEKAIVLPKLTTVQRNLLTPIDGMMIYNITSTSLNFYTLGQWYQTNAFPSGGPSSLMSFDEDHTITGTHEHHDNKFKIVNNLDITKKVRFNVDTTTGTERILTIPDTNGIILLSEGNVNINGLKQFTTSQLNINSTTPNNFSVLSLNSLDSTVVGMRLQNTTGPSEVGIYKDGTSGNLCSYQFGQLNIEFSKDVDLLVAGSSYKIQGTNINAVSESLTNKTISGLSNTITNIESTSIANGNITNTEFQYLDGTIANIQTQLNSKIPNITLPSLVTLTGAETVINKIFTSDLTHFQDNIDNTKTFRFNNSSQTTATNRIYTFPNLNCTLANNDDILKSNNANSGPLNTSDSSQNYSIGSIWINDDSHTVYVCTDNLLNNAKWRNMNYTNIGFQAFFTNSTSYTNVVCFTVLNSNAINGWQVVLDPISTTTSLRIYNISTATSITELTSITGLAQIVLLANGGTKFFTSGHTLCLQCLKSSGGGNTNIISMDQY